MIKRLVQTGIGVILAGGLVSLAAAPATAATVSGSTAIAAASTSAPVNSARGVLAARVASEPAGQYDTYCLGPDGSMYSWNGNPPSSCVGHLLTYISGKQVGNINVGATAGNPTVSCVLGVGAGVYSLFFASTPIGWGTLGAIAITGLGCIGF